MNRHERRAAEARARASGLDKSFEDYKTKVRNSYSASATDREIAEGYMRGEAWKASGAVAMILHPPGEPCTQPREGDLIVSVKYDAISFCAYVSPAMVTILMTGWEEILASINQKKPSDRREATRGIILECLIEHRYTDGNIAAMLASALIWLAVTSPVAFIFIGGELDRDIHYEITDTGLGQRNFRPMTHGGEELKQ
jgi:hypothetical protein